ncbi:MAG TPA: rRNA adenine dimethyltransferase family protein, partial [Anaerolineae bacterium]
AFKVVANLPYYITSAILRHILEARHKPRLVVVMVQREVAMRMAAQPPDMSLLAVSVQFFARVRIVRTISAGAFYPRPKVDSAVVRLDVFDPPRLIEDTNRFFEIVRAGFGERRKQLRNSLARGLTIDSDTAAAALARAHIDPTRRAETLTLDEWSMLCHALARHRGAGAKA